MSHILKCPKCESYGIGKQCACGHDRERKIPPKYSPEDKFAKYRREYKENVESK